VTSPGLLHLRTWLDPAVDERFSSWCDDHHLEHLAVPGFRRVRRGTLVASAADDPARFVTLYDLDDVDVLHSEGYEDYRRTSKGLPADLAPELRFARVEGTETGRWDASGSLEPDGQLVVSGPGLVQLFLSAERPAGQSMALLADVSDVAAEMATVDDVTLVRQFTTPNGDVLLVAELAADGAVDPAALPLPDAATADEVWAHYRFEYTATP
jgi:hypothetical protein